MKIKIYTKYASGYMVAETIHNTMQEVGAYLIGNDKGWYATDSNVVRVSDIINIEKFAE